MSRETSKGYRSDDKDIEIREAGEIESAHDLHRHCVEGGTAYSCERGDVHTQDDLTCMYENVGCMKDTGKPEVGKMASRVDILLMLKQP